MKNKKILSKNTFDPTLLVICYNIIKCISNNITIPTSRIEEIVFTIIDSENIKNNMNVELNIVTIKQIIDAVLKIIKREDDYNIITSYSENIINYNHILMRIENESPSRKIKAAYHEFQHAVQDKEINKIITEINNSKSTFININKKINYNYLIQLGENAIFDNDYHFYSRNHDKFYFEMEADAIAWEKTLIFFKQKKIKLTKMEYSIAYFYKNIRLLEMMNYSFDWLINNYYNIASKDSNYCIVFETIKNNIINFKCPFLNGNNDIVSSLITSVKIFNELNISNLRIDNINVINQAIKYQKRKLYLTRKYNEKFIIDNDKILNILCKSKLYNYNKILDVKEDILKEESKKINSKTYSIRK